MPRPVLPPTPASSTDIAAKDGHYLSSLEASFSLPSPAIAGKDNSISSGASNKSTSSSGRPFSPTSPPNGSAEHAVTRRRSSLAQSTTPAKEDFTLPPPPTRSRKIIQMKPRPQDQAPAEPSAGPSKPTSKTQSTNVNGGKKKAPSTTSVAGRKIARKTAHSLIERRRRSKMNEEFGVLKQMIPACKDQEMHKLAILQASIEYTRYLEQCIVDLKANSNAAVTPTLPKFQSSVAASGDSASAPSSHGHEEDEDDEMEEAGETAPTAELERHQSQSSSYSQSASPMLDAQRHYSYSSYSATTSPTFGPQRHYSYTSHSTSASPALLPQSRDSRDFDHEATEALLLLNTDRRNQRARGMSVRDLLSA